MKPDSVRLTSILLQLFTLQHECHRLLLCSYLLETLISQSLTNVAACLLKHTTKCTFAHQACFSSSDIAPFQNKYNLMLCQSCSHPQMSCHVFWKGLHFLPFYSSSPEVMCLLAAVQDQLFMEIGGLFFNACSSIIDQATDTLTHTCEWSGWFCSSAAAGDILLSLGLLWRAHKFSRHVYFYDVGCCIFLNRDSKSHPFSWSIMGPYLWKNKLVNGKSAMNYTYDVWYFFQAKNVSVCCFMSSSFHD